MPEANRKEKKSSAFVAALMPLKIKNMLTENRTNIPTKPSSSPIMERIKSLSAKGKKRYFCLELKSPVPNNPPLPSA